MHPADGQQVRARHGGATQQTVLGSSEAARAMVHRHLDHPVAAHLQHRRDEAMQAAIEHEPAQTLAAKRSERAAAVLDGLGGQPVADPVGDSRRHAPHEAVALGPVHAPAGRGVPVIEVREQRRDVPRIVLEVRVHHDDAAAARRLEPGIGRRRLAAVRLEPHQAHALVALVERADDLGATVAAAVVHEHHFERHAELIEHRAQLGPERGETFFLVVDGDDDREVSHPAALLWGCAGSCPATRPRASGGG